MRKRDFFHTGLDVSRSECAHSRLHSSGVFGDTYVVDGANGKDGNDGLVNSPLESIQEAITRQIANNSGLGDAIYIMPGTYAESIIASSLVGVQLCGMGYSPDAVIIAPTDSHALLVGADETDTVTMNNSALINMTFLTPSTSNVLYAAVTIAYMIKSEIFKCKFKGTTNTQFGVDATIGLQIGNRTDTPWEFHEHSRIGGCEFTSNAGRTTELGYGIVVGAQVTANPSYKGFKSMIIEDNIISALDTGIYMNTGATSCGGSVIRKNTITSQQGGIGPTGDGGIVSMAADGTDSLCMILDNRITASLDAIKNFDTSNVQGNIVAVGGGAPASETGQ